MPAYATANYQFVYSFGYLKSVRPGDRYHAVLNWYPTLSASDATRNWATGSGSTTSYGNPYPAFDNNSHKVIARPYHQLFGTTSWWQKGLFGVFGAGLPIPNGPDNGFYVSTDPIMVLESGSHLRGYQPGLIVPYGSQAVWDRKNFRDLPAMPDKVIRFILVGYAESQQTAGQRGLMGFDLTGPWR